MIGKKFSILCSAFFFLLIVSSAYAQSDETDNKVKISGYVQAQYQHFFIADTLGGIYNHYAKFSGGDVANIYTNDRFQVRRGRLKFTHNTDISQAVMSFDFTDKGFSVKDVYIQLTDPWINAFTLTGGMFNRPFGHEIDYSSSLRESPERSRIVQTLFPNERDVGVRFGFRMPKESFLNILSIDAAIVNGNGSAIETNNFKDFIGHIHLETPGYGEKDFGAGLGFSYYKGKVEHVYNPSDSSGARYYFVYDFGTIDSIYSDFGSTEDTTVTYLGFSPNLEASYAAENMATSVDRVYKGIDAQLYINTPFGKTEIRGEYIWGTQPGTVATSYLDKYGTIYSGISTSSPTGPALGIAWPSYDNPRPYDAKLLGTTFKPHHTMIRNFSGGYISFIQNLMESGHQIIIKYEWYDPNTDVAGNDIKLNFIDDNSSTFTYLSPADVKFTTIGIGWNWQINQHIKLSVYYENVRNEITAISEFSEQLINEGQWPAPGYDRDINDDVLTLRMQYKF
jgi:hypothetical protein